MSNVNKLAYTAVAAAILFSASSQAADVTTDRILKNNESQNWLSHHRTFDGQRFSPLNNINTKNVKDLNVAWTFTLGGVEGGGIWPHGGLQGTPLVEDGIMYVTDGWGSVYALKVTPTGGELLWKMNPQTDKDWVGATTCCGINNRGIALWKDKVVSHTLDGRLIVTNKKTGEIEWEHTVADPAKSESITAAPLIVKDMVITGVSGAEYGIRGWLAATDLTTHKEVWRFKTIPEPGEAGHETWKDDHNAWENGGGSTWVVGSFDPETNLIYWGVGNPGPDWDPEYRPGDNLYTNSAIAVDADTGELKWHFQYTPSDPYDYDGVNENTLVTIKHKGKARKVMLHADRNGYAYALDRITGEFVWGEPFVDKMTWTNGLDPVTGRPLTYNPNSDVQLYAEGTAPNREDKIGVTCPGNMGGKNWPPTSYNPNLRLWYIPVIESCNTITVAATEPGTHKVREWWTGGGPSQHEQIVGSVKAVDPDTGKVVATYPMQYPNLGGTLATGGELVFTSRPEGVIAALDGKNLKELWTFNTGGGLNAPPMTFSVDGKQYVAVLVGLGGAWPKWFVDGTAGLEKLEPSSSLYVFSLD